MNAFVLHGANVLDRAGEFSGPLDIGVVDGAVIEVGANVSLRDAVSIDFSDLFVMPGVFDCHLHIAASSLDAIELMRTPITQWALEAGQNIRRTLECGVTFVRDAAGADAGMREAVERGFTPGPRLQVAVVALSQTGGHVDGFLPGPGFEISADYVMPDYPGRLDVWGAPAEPDAALDELIGAAARVLAARPDAPIAFCHAVTAPAAVRLVLPELPDALRTASVAASWQSVGAIVAGFASPRMPAESDPAGDPPPAGAELAGRAVEHGDEHVIKLTEAALREHARTGDPTLLVAADRFRGRLDPP